MKKAFYLSLVLFTMLALNSCSKKGTTPAPPTVSEENIVFTIDPDPGVTTATATSGTYSFKLTITSKLPTSGVTIDYSTKKESDNTELEKKQITSTSGTADISTGTLAPTTLYSVSIVVTSKTKSTNTATKTFKVARK